MRFTKDGFDNMKAEYEELKRQRPAAVEDLKKARDMGDLKENGFYKASRQKLNFIDGRLTRLSYYLRNGLIISNSQGTSVAGIGTTVILSDGKKETVYKIVGDLEADPSGGKISLNSPLGSAISGHTIGDEISFRSPRGEVTFKIIKIA